MRAPRAAALAGCAVCVAGHGYVLDPPPRAAHLIKGDAAMSAGSCALGICYWFSQGCTIGCPKCGGSDGDPTCGAQQGTATLPDRARSFMDTPDCGTNPWCAPGSAPIFNPCGVAGGDVVPGKPGNGGDPPTGHKQGEDGRALPELRTTTTWAAGARVNISWSVIANHGGGYQYRLCKKSKKPTEACFQSTPIPFAPGGVQYINYCVAPNQFPPYNPAPGSFGKCGPNATAIPATDVSTGTVPAGSTWRRNPIPACKQVGGGAFGLKCGENGGTAAADYQFPPAGVDEARAPQLLGGFGAGGCYGSPYGQGCGTDGQNHVGGVPGSRSGVLMHTFQFNVVDEVVVPRVTPGEYIMSFRWDCEQTPQIWSTCSDVTIVGGGPAPPAPAPPAAQTYGCINNQCVADPTGVDKQICLAVCHK